MWRIFNKTATLIVLVAVMFNSGIDPVLHVLTTPLEKTIHTRNIVDRIYLARQNKNVVDNFHLAPNVAEAALDSAELEYEVDIGPVNGSTSANYVYASFFNPSGSGKTLVVKRIAVRANAVAAANYVNLAVRRTTAASAGTLISAANIPHKNTDSTDPVAEVRYAGATVTFAGATQSRLLGQPMTGAAAQYYSIRDITFGSSDEKVVLQPGEGIALYQEAAGDADERLRMYVEWEEVASAPTAQNEYLIAIQRVEVAATAGYVYNSFFNPAASGKTAIVKRIWYGTETCDTTAIYTNNMSVKRISAASGGTAISAANIPKKHTGSGNSAMDIRYTGVTVTQVGGTDARIGLVTPCGTTGQPSGWAQYDIAPDDEKIILQPGEGIALISETSGDIDQLTRMFVEWQEVSSGSTPTAQNEYVLAFPRISDETAAPALGTTFYTFFNPSGSGKTALVKRFVIRNNADTSATYSVFNYQRISAASGGTQITATDIPKKHTGSGTSIMEARYCGTTCASAITTTYVGSRSTASSGISDSGILKTVGPGTVAQMTAMHEIVLTPNEPFVLKGGEGVGFYLNYLAGDVDHYVKISIEWEEVTSAPSAQNQYLINIGPVPGSTATSYNYASFFNPSASGKTAVIKRVSVRVNTVGTAVYIPMRLRRTSAASGGTAIAAANIPVKNTSTANSAMDIRRTNVTVTYAQGADAQLIGVETPGAASTATAEGKSGYHEFQFVNDENIILQPGEGIALHHDTSAGSANLRVMLLIEWEEVSSGSTPSSQGEYLSSIGPVTANTSSGYVYASMFNPSSSGKDYVIKRLGVRSNRNGTLVAPGYIAITARGISAASGGTSVSTSNIAKKHTGTGAPTAELLYGGVTATFTGSAESRVLGVMAPGVVNQGSGIYESEVISGDELILHPGEGLALYQEATAGDALLRYRFWLEWKEVDAAAPSETLSFSISDNAIGFGTLSPSAARYATGDTTGSGTEVEAHTMSASTNASNGYVITVQGGTLTSGANTITALGASNTASSPGSEQFGLRMTASGGNGSVSSPYAASGFAFDTAAFPDQIASDPDGDDVSTTYSVRYLANMAQTTESGTYTTTLTYVITAGF